MANASVLGFTGALADPVTAAYPLGNGYRWYLPTLMRFNAPDSFSPFGAGGINPYAYCVADPINRIDPTGHSWESGLGEVIEAGARDVAEALHATDNDVDQSIAAASESLQRKKNAAAIPIQRSWRRFATERRHDFETTNAMLGSMGTRVTTTQEYYDLFPKRRVIVRSNGTSGSFWAEGHSGFSFESGEYSLLLAGDQNVKDHQFKAQYPTWLKIDDSLHPKDRAFIDSSTIAAGDLPLYRNLFESHMAHLIDKGSIFVLNEKYSEKFLSAFVEERNFFTSQPYSYGLHYNCKRFTVRTLKRLLDLSHSDIPDQ